MSSKCPFNPMKLRSLSCLANWNSNSVQNHWKVRSKPKHTVPNPPKVGVLPEHPSIMIMYACIYNCTIVVQMTFRSFSSIWDSYRNSIQFDDFPSEKTPFIVFFLTSHIFHDFPLICALKPPLRWGFPTAYRICRVRLRPQQISWTAHAAASENYTGRPAPNQGLQEKCRTCFN